MAGPKWRNFKLKNGGIVSIGYLPHGKGEFSWAAQYERPQGIGGWGVSFPGDITSGGKSLRKVMGELRLKIAADENPNIEKVTKKMGKERTSLYLEGVRERVIRNVGSSPVYIYKNPDYQLKGNGIVLQPGSTLEITGGGLHVVSEGKENPADSIDVLEIG